MELCAPSRSCGVTSSSVTHRELGHGQGVGFRLGTGRLVLHTLCLCHGGGSAYGCAEAGVSLPLCNQRDFEKKLLLSAVATWGL